jgi:hypothetical protein
MSLILQERRNSQKGSQADLFVCKASSDKERRPDSVTNCNVDVNQNGAEKVARQRFSCKAGVTGGAGMEKTRNVAIL